MLVQSPHTAALGVGSRPDAEQPISGRSYYVRLLDGFCLEEDGHPLAAPKAVRRLMAFVGVRGRTSRSEISGNLWPDVSETKAQACLRTTLWRLRQTAQEPIVVGDETLSLASVVTVDLSAFVTSAQRALEHVSRGPDSAQRQTVEHSMVDVGELLPGWYDDWVLFERERLRQLQLHALEAIALRLTAEGCHAQAVEAALAAVRLEPLRESAVRVLIIAHRAEHNIVEAVRCYRQFHDQLHRELGVTPTAELTRLTFGVTGL
ncbi:AfsR/SARP family transcriptional regulator [Actinoplanes auranticolor]|uniref:Bacterial transcriptional activator domain-containing protein n=1 Tax=Actinoplanes auranticolor TaxID=47988 RepID=A0A919SRV3_9ACTN|nr:BTAD domain-containing putative transcriptional regulator [Actinoplanes auranticolor]GIM76399.1 hypothetical protein Aau02nite_70670 [Actinoplanes auranticolor]